MAEIKVEKKKSNWPWVLIILAILVVFFLLFMLTNGDNDKDDIDEAVRDEQVIDQYKIEESTDNPYPENSVAGFLTHIEEGSYYQLGKDPDYTHEALYKLVQAVRETSFEVKYKPDEDFLQLDQEIDSIPAKREAEIQTDTLYDTGQTIISTMEDLQSERFPELSEEVQELRADLNAINSNTEMEEQTEIISSFFEQAAHVIKEMNGVIPPSPVSRGYNITTSEKKTITINFK